MSDIEHSFNFILVGESNVGKTSILYKFVDNTFIDNYIATIGTDYKKKIINIDGKKISLRIWDTAGEERFRTLSFKNFKRCNGIILTFDLSDKSSFEKITYWLEQINLNIDIDYSSIILLGNKCDIKEREKFDEEINNFTKKINLKYFETSAKTGENIENAILYLTREIISKKKPNDDSFTLNKKKIKKNKNKKCSC